MNQSALYEFPLNERMRNFMRLENCFDQIQHFSQYNSVWDNQASLLVLLEMMNLMERHDVKNEISKELERSITTLKNLLDTPGINTTRLQTTLDALYTQLTAMQNINGRAARRLREDDLLNSIKQRSNVTLNINTFDIPSYYFWLNQNTSVRQTQLQQWFMEIQPLGDALNLLLNLIRDSATFEAKTAETGFFQRPFSSQQVCQMIRIELPHEAKYFPEASGSKHRVSIRFMTYENTKQRAVPITSNVEFNLSCCGI